MDVDGNWSWIVGAVEGVAGQVFKKDRVAPPMDAVD